MYGVCNISVIPLRAEPSHKKEMVSQLLFGDLYLILKEENGWMKIKTTDCGYEGWMEKKMNNPFRAEEVDHYLTSKKYMVRDYLLTMKDLESDITFPVFRGSSFPYPQNDKLTLGNSTFTLQLPPVPVYAEQTDLSDKQVNLIQFASSYLNTPYLWGGRTPAGIDCSAFVQLAYKSIEIDLPRDASQQVAFGEGIDFIDESQVGDVAFFQNEEGAIVHTGIVYDKNKIIHASGVVRIDALDQTGIFNKYSEKYTHQLRIVKRIL
ncbi:MAG: C40 family peptidase [Bacteroidales bacterium]